MRLVGAASDASGPEAQPMHPSSSTSGGLDEEQGNLRRSSTQLNRERVQDHQRMIAGETLLNTTALLGCMGLLFLGIIVAGVVIYVTGWMVWSKSREKPCDQPLQWWLFAMLLIPIIQCQLSGHTEGQRPRKLQALLMPALLCSGIYLISHCKTCSETNPSLYQFVKLYLIFQSVCWLTMMFMFVCFVSVIMWAHSRGLLPTNGAGPSNPAKPGTIDEIETVPFSAELFSEIPLDDHETPECAICQEKFNSEKIIKKTPCGHYFHEECLREWLEKFAKSCPLCRLNLEDALEEQSLP